MNCQTVSDHLPEWAVARLDDEQAALLEEHLESCATCAEEAQSYRSMMAPLGTEAVPSEAMRLRVVRMIDREAGTSSHAQPARWLMAAAMIGAVALILFLVRPSDTSAPQSGEEIATDRLRDIALIRQSENRSSDLTHAFASDPNPAIRLAALDSLVQTANPSELRPALERALLSETSPMVRDAVKSILDEVEK